MKPADEGWWMPMFPALWLDDDKIINKQTGERQISLAQEGAYLRLCLTQFRLPTGILPKRRSFLVDAVGCKDSEYETLIHPVLAMFFDERPDGWTHDKVRAAWLHANQKRLQASKAAKSLWSRVKDASASCDKEKKTKKKTRQNVLVAIGEEPALHVLHHWSSESGIHVRSEKVQESILVRIRARLKEGFTVEELKRCVDVAKHDPFYVERGYYKQPEVIFRNAERIQSLLARLQHAAARPLPL